MRYQTKRKVRRVVLIAVLAAIVLGLGGWLIYHFSTPEVPLEERVMTLTADSAQRVTALNDGLLLASGLTLSRIDLAGDVHVGGRHFGRPEQLAGKVDAGKRQAAG